MKLNKDTKIISLDKEEVMRLCHPGAGADTCICLVVGENGFECIYHCFNEGRNLLGETMGERWDKGLTVAKRRGCDEMIKYSTEKA